ncbi:MAG: 4-hydroxybenzoate polyprenyltransferase [Epsilonproteobacteria bacterium]|nr:4-hydroxybenzoate polyprenyltransferase [Campylobacterota bacterium]
MKQKLKNFSELVVFEHTIFSMPFIFLAMVVAARGWFGWRLLFLGALAAISARNFAMGVNRYLDRDIDALNPRTKNRPSVDGRVSTKEMLVFIIINGAIFIVVAYFINSLAFKLSIPILFILGAYTLFKRFSALAHIVLGISLGLAPIAGAVAVLADIPLWVIYLSIGVTFWVAGFDLLYSLQDMEFDKKHKLHSIPAKLGAQNTLNLAAFFHLITIICWYMFVKEASLGVFSYIAIIVAALMLFYEHYLVRKDFKKIDRAFFTINGYLGFIFFILVTLDVILSG